LERLDKKAEERTEEKGCMWKQSYMGGNEKKKGNRDANARNVFVFHAANDRIFQQCSSTIVPT